MENGNVISVRPELGTLVMFHNMPMSPMAKVGRSPAAVAMSRREFFNMIIKECKRQFDKVMITPGESRSVI